jgi:transcriptional regulator with XRE-family HTH domain
MPRETGIIEAFAKLIKQMRENQKLTIEQLADLSDVHRTTIGLLERNERTPTLQVASQIAKALDLPLSELIQEAELIANNKITPSEIAHFHQIRKPNREHLRNEDILISTLGIDGNTLIKAIDSCYQTLDAIDEQLIGKNAPPMSQTVELANLSSMIGNMIGGGIADHSNGLYSRNKPHAFPDLLPVKSPAVDLELKMALETNKPKGHLPKAGTYITFRYVLGNKKGEYIRGKQNRSDTVWIWEVKIGSVTEADFSISNTPGDSGKTANIITDVFNNMTLVYYMPKHLPYAPKANGQYVGYN